MVRMLRLMLTLLLLAAGCSAGPVERRSGDGPLAPSLDGRSYESGDGTVSGILYYEEAEAYTWGWLPLCTRSGHEPAKIEDVRPQSEIGEGIVDQQFFIRSFTYDADDMARQPILTARGVPPILEDLPLLEGEFVNAIDALVPECDGIGTRQTELMVTLTVEEPDSGWDGFSILYSSGNDRYVLDIPRRYLVCSQMDEC